MQTALENSRMQVPQEVKQVRNRFWKTGSFTAVLHLDRNEAMDPIIWMKTQQLLGCIRTGCTTEFSHKRKIEVPDQVNSM